MEELYLSTREVLLGSNVPEILPIFTVNLKCSCQFHILLKTDLSGTVSKYTSHCLSQNPLPEMSNLTLIVVLVFSTSHFCKTFDICFFFFFNFPLFFTLLGGSHLKFVACPSFSVLSTLISVNSYLSEVTAECLLSLTSCDIYLAAVVILLVFGNKYQPTCFKKPWHLRRCWG